MNMQPHIAGSPENPGEHDYNLGTGLFAKVASREKQEIMLPAIKGQLNRLVSNCEHIKSVHRILDFGCGPFTISVPLIRDGFRVDGYDLSEEMISTAKDVLKAGRTGFSSEALLLADDVKLRSSLPPEDQRYNVVMMNFVHQVAADRKELKALFATAAGLLGKNGHLIITGAHPDYLHKPHSCCEYDVVDSSLMKDGDTYTGRIIDSSGSVTYRLNGDHYWRKDTIIKINQELGLSTGDVIDIDDKETLGRPANSPAYFLMRFKNTHRLAA